MKSEGWKVLIRREDHSWVYVEYRSIRFLFATTYDQNRAYVYTSRKEALEDMQDMQECLQAYSLLDMSTQQWCHYNVNV